MQSAPSAIILASEGRLSLCRATPMPPSCKETRLLRVNFLEDLQVPEAKGAL